MEASMVQARSYGRKPLAALGKLTVATLIGMALTVIFVMAAMFGQVDPMGLAFSAIPLAIAAIVAWGWRWAPLLGALISGLLLAFVGPGLPHFLSSPSSPMFAPILVLLVLAVVGITAGVGAAVQNYRYAADARRTPRWLAWVLAALAGLVAGAVMVAAVPQPGTAASVNPEALGAMPVLTTKDFEFAQTELHAKVGETVTLRFENVDPEAHSFDIDELNVHAPIPVDKPSVAIFKPTKPGTYTFYCAPHSDKKTGMVGTLIVQ